MTALRPPLVGSRFVALAVATALIASGAPLARADDAPPPEPAAAALPPPGPPADVPAKYVSTGKEAPSESKRNGRVFGWAALAIGGESAVVAVATSLMLIHDKNVRDNGCNAQKVCTPSGLDANTTIHGLIVWNTASWIVAAAGLGAGAYLVLSNRPDGGSTGVSVSPTPAGMSFALRSVF